MREGKRKKKQVEKLKVEKSIIEKRGRKESDEAVARSTGKRGWVDAVSVCDTCGMQSGQCVDVGGYMYFLTDRALAHDTTAIITIINIPH